MRLLVYLVAFYSYTRSMWQGTRVLCIVAIHVTSDFRVPMGHQAGVHDSARRFLLNLADRPRKVELRRMPEHRVVDGYDRIH